MQKGSCIGPVAFDDGWAMAEFVEVRRGGVEPLDRVRSKVISGMKGERAGEVMK